MKAPVICIVTLAILILPQTAGQDHPKYAKCYERFRLIPSLCMASIARYYYDISQDTCVPFVYGGCGQLPENSFPTEDACSYACIRE